MNFLYRALLCLLAKFDAEWVHELFIHSLRMAGRIARIPFFKRPLQIVVSGGLSAFDSKSSTARRVFDLDFANPVGLAAGLDKNGAALEGLALIPFGFLEIGTVTPLAQSGNPRPRLFRNYRDQVIFNAMGFNNLGSEYLKKEVLEARPHLPASLKIGINIGKNAVTPLTEAPRDYARCARELHDCADYLTINVSSPNTKGLRSLQSFEALAAILEGVFGEVQKFSRPRPVLIKLAPEIPGDDLESLVSQIEKTFPVAGWIVTNTLMRESPWKQSSMPVGGLSGAPLVEEARKSLVEMRRLSSKPLVSSGGIIDAAEARKRFELGASLVQLYAGLIFRGPRLVREIVRAL